jgi:hypothetical protein
LKIVTFALAILIFSAVATMFNALDIFNYKIYEPGYNISESEANAIYTIDEPTVDTKQGVIDKISDAIGFESIYAIIKIIGKALGMALNLGGLFKEYVPGVVGMQFSILINAVTYFVYAWGGIQIWRKISTKGME